jgi:hypothetical protein
MVRAARPAPISGLSRALNFKGKALLTALLAEGKSQHHPTAGIMIINGNDAARHTYESLGFRPYQAFHAEYFATQFQIDFPGITKFSLQLC